MFAYADRRYRFDKHLVEVWSHFEHCIPKALRMLNKRIVGLTPVVTQCGDVRVEVLRFLPVSPTKLPFAYANPAANKLALFHR